YEGAEIRSGEDEKGGQPVDFQGGGASTEGVKDAAPSLPLPVVDIGASAGGLVSGVISTSQPASFPVQRAGGSHFLLKIGSYWTAERAIRGAMLELVHAREEGPRDSTGPPTQ